MTAPTWEQINDREGDLPALKRLLNTRMGRFQRAVNGKQSALGWISVADSGAVADGVHDDTAAIQRAIAKLGTRGVLFFPPGVYKVTGAPTLSATSGVTVLGYGATLQLNGVNAYGLKLAGMNDQLHIYGLRVAGSGVVGDNHEGIGTATTPGVGVGGKGLVIRDVVVEDCTRGIYLDVGVTFDWWDVLVDGCTILRTNGVNSGQGYGITLSGCWGGRVRDCYVEYSTRHAIYISAGDKHVVSGCTIYRHRYGIGTSNSVGALEVARNNDVLLTDNTLVECTDNAMHVRPDETNSRDSRNMVVRGNTFIDSTTNDLVLGNQSPSTSGAFEGILVEGNTFIRSSDPTNIGYAIRVFHGIQVRIADNYFDGDRNYTITIAPIYVVGAEGTTYTEQGSIEENQGQYTATGGGYVGFVEFGAPICSGSATVRVVNNNVTLSGGSGQNLTIYDAAVTSTTIEMWGNTVDETVSTAIGPAFRAFGSAVLRGDLQARAIMARNSAYGFADYFNAIDGTNRATWGLTSVAGGFGSKIFQAGQGWEFYDQASALVAYLADTGALNVLLEYRVAGTKVVGARDTGWVPMTGTPDKGSTFDTTTVTLPQLAGRVMALQAALTAHGSIGT